MTEYAAISERISNRDALDRAGRITTERAANTLHAQALTSGDTQLMNAITSHAKSMGWTITEPSPAGLTRESTKARALLIEILKLASTAPNRLDEALTFTDVRFSEDALRTERETRAAETRATLTATVTTLAQQIDDLNVKATTKADRARPAIDPADAAQLARTAQAWQWNILPALTEHTDWASLLPNLTIDELLAVERFAPAWIRTNKDRFEAPTIINNVINAVRNQYPDTVVDTTTKGILLNARDTAAYAEEGNTIARSIGALRNPSDGTHLTIRVQNTAYNIGALPDLTGE